MLLESIFLYLFVHFQEELGEQEMTGDLANDKVGIFFILILLRMM